MLDLSRYCGNIRFDHVGGSSESPLDYVIKAMLPHCVTSETQRSKIT